MGMELKKLEDQIRNLNLEESGGKRDLLPLYADSKALDALVKYLAEPFRGKIDCVCSPEPLGFIIGSMLARELGVGFVAIRRNSQFWIDPEEQVTASYINHRDKVTSLVTERKILPAGGSQRGRQDVETMLRRIFRGPFEAEPETFQASSAAFR